MHIQKEGATLRKFIFKDTKKNTETLLPVTPESFTVSHGIRIETINIHTLGDVSIAGYKTLAAIKVDCLFPARAYPFLTAGAGTSPYEYVKLFEGWADEKTVLRFVVSETPVNIPVLVEEISYGEKDGSGDIYANVSLREYRELKTVQIDNTGNDARPGAEATVTPESYTIRAGDTLWAICRDYYGDSSLYAQLAAYNNIKNPNLIYTGNTIKLPDKSRLQGAVK